MPSHITATFDIETRACRICDAWTSTMIITTAGTTSGAGCDGEMV
jgi:hypothetical protein